MNIPNLKQISKDSSSSSSSLKFIPDYVMERRIFQKSTTKDLFDQLLDQKNLQQDNQQIFPTISQLNFLPWSIPNQDCKCFKIDCLKMYCQCFSKGKVCNQKCECISCCNKIECQIRIFKAQQIANFRHPGTFKNIPVFIPLRRCTCKKSQRHKNYYEYFRARLKCTEQCECIDCQNQKPHRHDDYLVSRMQIEVNT